MDTLRYFWKKATAYPFILSAFFLAVLWSVIGQEFLSILILRQVFDLMVEHAAAPAKIYDDLIFWLMVLAVANLLFTLIGWRAAEFLNDYFQPKVMRDIEEEVFYKLHHHSYHFFTNHFTGGLVSKANRFVSSFEKIADIVQWSLWRIIIMLGSSLVIILYFAPIIALSLLLWTLIYVSVSYGFSRWALPYWRKNAVLDSRVTAEIADSLTNVLNIKIFAGKKIEFNRFGGTISDRRKARTRSWNTGSWMRAWQGVMMISFELLLLYLLIQGWSRGDLSLGTIFAIQHFIWRTFASLWELGQLFQDYSNALADAEEMVAILQQDPSVKDPLKPQTVRIKQGEIEFKGVGFRYENASNTPWVFQNFQLKIPAGQKIGLVGESGAGKSTFVNLLIRFMDVQDGEILIDQQNIRSITQDDLRRQITYVPQEPILFHRSLRENIAYGRPNASEAEIIAAAQAAHAHEFIQSFPQQYQTLVGERGVKLSGGQKQRVAIARAMLKAAPILILDEATSSLDSKAEQHIQAALAALIQQRTTLVIAHRLSTLRQMDRIVVFVAGKIAEEGTHEELIQKNGKYAELWKHQSGGFIA